MNHVTKLWGGLILVLGCYVAVYGGLLWYTDGLPYVLDNNESFSSLWHAYNLYHFDISKSMGLADETFAYHAAAHPFVHTHQGNFPRLFAFVIYVLGATTVQSQIVVTTFTVGLAGVALAYVFFTRIVDPLFAILFCLLAMTDYVLVAQWQVVTYRVWHLFFVFSSLLCVHLLSRRKALGIALTVLNFACLFYYELVFVFFVSLSCALYAAIYLRGRWANVLTFWAAQALGGAIALSALAAQLILYMGRQDVLTDFRFTFLGRNYLSDSTELALRAREFYERHNVAFWYNLEDGSQFKSLRHFFGSLTYFEFQIHTPFWTTVCFVLLLGVFTSLFLTGYGAREPDRTGALPPRTGLRRWGTVGSLTAGVALFASCVVLVSLVLNGDMLLGVLSSGNSIPVPSALALSVAALIALAIWAFVRPQGASATGARNTLRSTSEKVTPLFWAAFLVSSIAFLVLVSPRAYGQRYSALWLEIADGFLRRPVLLLTFFGIAVVSCLLAFGHPAAPYRSRYRQVVCGLLPFWGAGFVAYAVTFYLSPAYIFSGYRFRLAPFTVFHTTTLSALALYPLVLPAMDVLGRRHKSASIATKRSPAIFKWLCAAVLVVVGSYWVSMQMTYLRILPAQHYAFLRRLSEPPFKDKGFVVSGYAGPIAAATHSWAYMDDNLVRNILVVAAGTNELQFDRKYLWFADRGTNPAYQKPDYFICIASQTFYALGETASRRAGRGAGSQSGCEKHQLVRIARKQEVGGFNPRPEIAAADADGLRQVGYERWVVVKLNWSAESNRP